MDFCDFIISKSQQQRKKIVLPESLDDRVLKATVCIETDNIADIVLLGNREEILDDIGDKEIGKKVAIYDPVNETELTDKLANVYFEKRKHKGMTFEAAREFIIEKPHFYGALLVEIGKADGMVCGAQCTTAETLRGLIHCVGTDPDSELISSFFVMKTNNETFGKEGSLFFADCAVNPNPTAKELASIAMDTAKSFKALMGEDAKVALLSFSSKGSAQHPLVDKVKDALYTVQQKNPHLAIDGELQLDAAIIPSIGRKKAPESDIAGHANCLIFPDLQSGNIGYKIAERIGGAAAIGPVIQGAKKPINDLSRGCSTDDIVYVTAITAVQAMG